MALTRETRHQTSEAARSDGERLELTLTLTPGGTDSYTVDAVSPLGMAQGAVRLPAEEPPPAPGDAIDPEDRHRNVTAISHDGRETSGKRTVGADLFDALFENPDVRTLYELTRATASGEGLRIRLVLDPGRPGMPRLYGRAWERMVDTGRAERLACEGHVSIVRSLVVRRPPRAFVPRRPLRILALFSGADDLDLEAERALLDGAAKGPGLEIHWAEADDLDALEQLLREAVDRGRPFHGLHLAGHGTRGLGIAGGGGLLWEQEEDPGHTVAGSHLSAVLRQFPDLQLVVLNACETADLPVGAGNPFSGVATALLKGGLPVVVAMRGPIRDDAAVSLTGAFYRRLGQGAVPEEALSGARWDVWLRAPERDEWARPILFQGAELRRPFPRWMKRVGLVLVGCILLLTAVTVRQTRSLCQERVERAVEQANALLLDRQASEAAEVLHAALGPNRCWGADSTTLASVHADLAAAEQDLGDLHRAVDEATLAVRLDPNRAVHRYNLGALLVRSGRPAEAIRPLRDALDLDPTFADAANELGAAFLDLGRLEDARDMLSRGLTLDPTSPRLHKHLGRTLLALGQPKRADESFRRALELTPAEDWPLRADLYYWLAESADAAGDGKRACTAVERFRRIDPAGVTEESNRVARLERRLDCAALSAVEEVGR